MHYPALLNRSFTATSIQEGFQSTVSLLCRQFQVLKFQARRQVKAFYPAIPKFKYNALQSKLEIPACHAQVQVPAAVITSSSGFRV